MRYSAKETAEKHERILTEAARLFRERGFAGAGVAEIMQAAGLTHGAFYAHFPSKEALASAALTHAFEQTNARRQADTGDPKQAFLDRYLSVAHRDRPGAGCAIAALGPEVARDETSRAPFTEQVTQMIDDMSERFTWGDARDAAGQKDRSRQNAIHLLSSAVGALILARAVNDPELSEEILASVRDSLAE
ncbi:MAG: TetR/AcrR family transcriptional regulator [Alphaproteobacteria bacterium]|nr:TetR/AcrR family transcriptional regulator [Alphaproteobacteria bacterium]MBU0798623.1 TetR/AcrR family transcriptional regulator [Alphaproteobacteria bacterium]MBU0888362.1 TetR/AcrR family transcriptional regulator [Alphaproteobacteria bacterium]MBU1814673.1 TetR/AcrR family transcriptional regulator [Alphaproteobacteria bacterium]